MSNYITHENPIIFLPKLAKILGTNESIILSLIHFWTNPSYSKNFKDDKYWVYNTYEQWQKQLPNLSISSIKRAINKLEKQNILVSKQFSNNPFVKLKWYSIDYEVLHQLLPNELIPHSYRKKQNISSEKNLFTSIQSDQTVSSNRDDSRVNLTRSIKVTKESTNKTNYSLSLTKADNTSVKNQVEETLPERELIKIWNEEFKQEGREKTKLTPERRKALMHAYKAYFDSNTEMWQCFCSKIRSSKFLMGEVTNFKASFDWCVKPQNIQKILEGNYKLYDRIIPKSQTLVQCDKVELSKHLDPTWSKVLDKLKVSMGADTVKSWIEKLTYQRTGEKSVKLTAPMKFIERTVIEQYKERVLNAFCSIGISIEELVIDYACLH